MREALVICYSCPMCETVVQAPGNAAGQKTECPTCGLTLRIPTASTIPGQTVLAQLVSPSPMKPVPALADSLLRFACTNCGKRLKAPSTNKGRTATCPRCGCSVEVPSGGKKAVPPPLPEAPLVLEVDEPAPGCVPWDCPSCQRRFDLPSGSVGHMIDCPLCQFRFAALRDAPSVPSPIAGALPPSRRALLFAVVLPLAILLMALCVFLLSRGVGGFFK